MIVVYKSSKLNKIEPIDKKLIAVYSIEDAKIIFRDLKHEQVIILNNKNGKFGVCNNLKEVEDFLNIE